MITNQGFLEGFVHRVISDYSLQHESNRVKLLISDKFKEEEQNDETSIPLIVKTTSNLDLKRGEWIEVEYEVDIARLTGIQLIAKNIKKKIKWA